MITNTIYPEDFEDIENHEASKDDIYNEGFVDKTISHTLAGVEFPKKFTPINVEYLKQHKQDLLKFKLPTHRVDINNITDFNNQLGDELQNLFTHIIFAKDFNIYNKHRVLLCELFDIEPSYLIKPYGQAWDVDQFTFHKEDSVAKNLKPDDVLYHTNKVPNLTSLQPTFMSRRAKALRGLPKKFVGVEALYPTPRIYVGLNSVMTRYSSEAPIKNNGVRIYKILNHKNKVKSDKELHGDACYIETTSPVKVVDITDEYFKSKEIKESFTERNVFKMNEQITNILEAFKSGVLSTEEATAKLNVIQEAAIEESKQEDTSENSNNEMFMTKQNHIMESYKLGIINSQEAIQLIERITMESEYMSEEDDMDDMNADEGEGNDEPETSDSSEDISALAEYINSLDEETRAQLMGAINAPAEGNNSEPVADDEGNVENVEEGSIPTNSDVSEPVEGPDTVREYANTALNEMEV